MTPILMPADLGSATLARWMQALVALDADGWPLVLLEAADPADPLDALSLAAYLAPRTRQIGLGVTVDALGVEPFTLARGLATLDHLSGGRAAWRLVGSDDAGRLAEHAAVTAALLTSWDRDALACDREAGLFSRSEAVRPIHHKGPHYSVRGPLNIPQPPQGVPPRLALPGDVAAAGADLLADAASLHRPTLVEAGRLAPPPAYRAGQRLRDRLEMTK